MVNEQIKADGTLVSIDVWRDDPSKVRIFIKDRDTIIIPRNYLYEMRQCIDDLSGGEGYKFEPQESNKEGEPLQKAFTRGNSCLYYQRRIRRSWWIETKRPR